MTAIDVVAAIKAMFAPQDWDIASEDKLCEWMLSDKATMLLPDEYFFAAKELIQQKKLGMTAKHFFTKGCMQASFLDRESCKPKSALETILAISPEFLWNELGADVVRRAVELDPDFINSEIYLAMYGRKAA